MDYSLVLKDYYTVVKMDYSLELKGYTLVKMDYSLDLKDYSSMKPDCSHWD